MSLNRKAEDLEMSKAISSYAAFLARFTSILVLHLGHALGLLTFGFHP